DMAPQLAGDPFGVRASASAPSHRAERRSNRSRDAAARPRNNRIGRPRGGVPRNRNCTEQLPADRHWEFDPASPGSYQLASKNSLVCEVEGLRRFVLGVQKSFLTHRSKPYAGVKG